MRYLRGVTFALGATLLAFAIPQLDTVYMAGPVHEDRSGGGSWDRYQVIRWDLRPVVAVAGGLGLIVVAATLLRRSRA